MTGAFVYLYRMIVFMLVVGIIIAVCPSFQPCWPSFNRLSATPRPRALSPK